MSLTISAAALASIASCIRAGVPALETGGALFGPTGASIIEHAIGPGPGAVHRPSYFLRDLGYTQVEAKRIYELDSTQWIGEWHTHPGAPLIPSQLDLSTYAQHLHDEELAFDRFIALICSAGAQLAVTAWTIEVIDGQVQGRPELLTVHTAAAAGTTREASTHQIDSWNVS